MSSKRQVWPQARRLTRLLRPAQPQAQSICPFCSIAPNPRIQPRSRQRTQHRRLQSTTVESVDPRKELELTLQELGKHAPNFVSLSRLQLALQALQQRPGEEAIRIAILGLRPEDDAAGAETAKRIIRAILADPLVDEEAWERELAEYDPSRPLIIRIRPGSHAQAAFEMERGNAINEIQISSPGLNNLHVELLLMSTDFLLMEAGRAGRTFTADELLTPNVPIAIGQDQASSLATPVHKLLLVGNSGGGLSDILSVPDPEGVRIGTIERAVNMEGLSEMMNVPGYHAVDAALAEKAVARFREGPQYAVEYEKMWTSSKLPMLKQWLQTGLVSESDGTKPVVRDLIASLLEATSASIQTEEARKTSQKLQAQTPLNGAGELNGALAQWSQNAHAELQGELDLAFTGRRWRMLGWWKLFWRVDDVTMLTNEMLSQRFLPTAEQELVYLTGRIEGQNEQKMPYTQPTSSQEPAGTQPSTKLGSGEVATISPKLPKWPGHVAFTRRYLQNETVPALQALAQKLVMQSVGTSSIATSLAALLYVSSFVSSLYEAGAVAALGIVYSLGRMQKKWEAARGFWEGDVREEGRKAVRAAEQSVGAALEGGVSSGADGSQNSGLDKARELVTKAEDALSRMK